jgi:hypothetical protein
MYCDMSTSLELDAGLALDASERPCRKILLGMRHGDPARANRVLQLDVASFLGDFEPAVSFEAAEYVSAAHFAILHTYTHGIKPIGARLSWAVLLQRKTAPLSEEMAPFAVDPPISSAKPHSASASRTWLWFGAMAFLPAWRLVLVFIVVSLFVVGRRWIRRVCLSLGATRNRRSTRHTIFGNAQPNPRSAYTRALGSLSPRI